MKTPDEEPGAQHERSAITRRTALGAAAALGLAVASGSDFAGASRASAAGVYQFPFSPSTITVGFGVRDAEHPNGHRGTDFAPGAEAFIPCIGDGVVVRNGWNDALGNILLVDHKDGYYSGYSHMLKRGIVAVGTAVSRGQHVGQVGNTGSQSFGAHLHLTVGTSLSNPEGGAVIDPVPFINARDNDSAPITPSPTPILSGDTMIRIQSTNRGIALIGAGYYRQLRSTEEVQQSDPIIEKHITGNDRQFDLWVSMALSGVSAKPQV